MLHIEFKVTAEERKHFLYLFIQENEVHGAYIKYSSIDKDHWLVNVRCNETEEKLIQECFRKAKLKSLM